MNTLHDELWPLIVAGDWQVYAGLLAVPKFARLAMKDLIGWRRRLTVEVTNERGTKWRLAGKTHREDDLPASINNGGIMRWRKHGRAFRVNGQPHMVLPNEWQVWQDDNRNFHRDGDLPAVVYSDGRQTWHHHGKIHRENGPADVNPKYKEEVWYHHGNVHRGGDLPAVINIRNKIWMSHGLRHRDGDLPAVIDSSGGQWWYKDGAIHREGDLPAVIDHLGTQLWYKNDMIHRIGGLPAIIRVDGTKEWWVNGARTA